MKRLIEAGIEQAARELHAAQYDALGLHSHATALRTAKNTTPAHRAIVAALSLAAVFGEALQRASGAGAASDAMVEVARSAYGSVKVYSTGVAEDGQVIRSVADLNRNDDAAWRAALNAALAVAGEAAHGVDLEVFRESVSYTLQRYKQWRHPLDVARIRKALALIDSQEGRTNG